MNRITRFLDLHQKHWPETYDRKLLPLRIALFYAEFEQLSRVMEIISASGLSLGEFDVLTTLRRSPPPYTLTPTDIQQSMLITSGGLTKLMTELEKRGLVTRTIQREDRRIKPVILHDKALPLLDKITKDMNEVLSSWINQSLTDSEISQLTALLTKLTN